MIGRVLGVINILLGIGYIVLGLFVAAAVLIIAGVFCYTATVISERRTNSHE